MEGERGFTPPQTSDADKAAIRDALPHGLRDANSRVRTAVGMAIAAVAAWDWPQAWPGLLEFLVASIKAKEDANLGELLVLLERCGACSIHASRAAVSLAAC